MAKVQAEFELNITGNIKKSLEEIGLSSDKAEKIVSNLSKTVIKGFAEQEGSINKVNAQLKINEQALNSLSKEEQKNSDIGKKLISQRQELLKIVEQDKQSKKELVNIERAKAQQEQKALDIASNSIQALKMLNAEMVKQRDTLDPTSEAFARLGQEILKNEDKLKAYDEQIGRNQRNVGNYASANERLKPQIMAIRQELEKMTMAGEQNTKAFFKLQMQAAEYRDTIGDVNTKISILADDMFYINAAVDATRALASGYQLVQSVQALTGNSSEELMKTMVKLQAVMGVVNALQEISNLLQETGRIRILGNVIAIKAMAVAQVIANLAQKAFNITLTATTVLVAGATAGLSLLVVGIYAIVKWMGSASEETEKYNKELEKMEKNQANLVKTSDEYIKNIEYKLELMKAEGKSTEEISKQERFLAVERAGRAKAIEYGIMQQLEKEKLKLKTIKEGSDEEKESKDKILKLNDELNNQIVKRLDLQRAINIFDAKALNDEKIKTQESIKLQKEKQSQKLKIKQDELKATEEINNQIQEEEQKAQDEIFQQLQTALDKEAEKIIEMNEQELNDYIKLQEQKQSETEALRDKYITDEETKLQEQANLEIMAVNQSILNEEEKYKAITEINNKLYNDLSNLDEKRKKELESLAEFYKTTGAQTTQALYDLSTVFGEQLFLNNEETKAKIRETEEADKVNNQETLNTKLTQLGTALANEEITRQEYNLKKLEAETDFANKQKEIQVNATKALNDEDKRLQQERAKAYKDVLKKLLISVIDAYMKTAIAKVSFESFSDFGLSLLKVAPILALGGIARGAISALADGGLMPNKRNIVLTNDGKGSNFQEFVVNGNRTKKYTKELQIINSGSEQQVQSLFSGAGVKGSVPNLGGTALASGGLAVGSISSNSDILKSLESLSQTIAITNARVETAINRSNISDKLKIADNREVLLMTKRGQNQLNEVR